MAERKKIGLLFSVSEGWIGGTYYFLNIIASLNLLADHEKPHIIVYSSDDSGYAEAVKLGYPYLSYQNSLLKYSLLERGVNFLSRKIFKIKLIQKKLSKNELPVLFGYYEQILLHHCSRKIFWIPDFQEHYYPDLIGAAITAQRIKTHKKLIADNAEIIFSSNTALNDFKKIYGTNNCRTSTVKFAVNHPDFSSVNFKVLQDKFGINNHFFFTPNQFWPHKNHLIILKAVAELKKQNIEVQVVFSGKLNEQDAHVIVLKEFIKINALERNICFVGFIKREEILTLMQNSAAVIQPSLFEGWSTVVEDAKALNKSILLSDLPVHREQCSDYNCKFFHGNNSDSLVDAILETSSTQNAQSIRYEYAANRQLFAKQFLKATA